MAKDFFKTEYIRATTLNKKRKGFWDTLYDRAEVYGKRFFILASIIVFVFILFVIINLFLPLFNNDIYDKLISILLGTLSISLGFLALGLAVKSNKNHSNLLGIKTNIEVNSPKTSNVNKHLWHRLNKTGLLIFIVLILLLLAMFLIPNQFINLAYFGLVAMTIVYAYFTGLQAEANVKMLDEMKEERLATSQPIVIPKSVNKYRDKMIDTSQFSHFSIFNAGNGTAVGVTYAITDKNKLPLNQGYREAYLKTGEEIKYEPNNVELVNGEYFLFCQYFGISQITGNKLLNQTWLPFNVTKDNNHDNGLSILPFDPLFEFDVSDNNAMKIYIITEAE